jgi:hypothetical protein
MSPADESPVRDHKKSTNDLTNTITMVMEPPTPLAAWIWWIHTNQGVGGILHICLEESRNFYVIIDLYILLKSSLPAGNNGSQNGIHCRQRVTITYE